VDRRRFLAACSQAGLGIAVAGWRTPAAARAPLASRRLSSLAEALRAGDETARALATAAPTAVVRGVQAGAGLSGRFGDLPRHFVFEYYPWYEASPWRHWDQWDRLPPDDIASNHVPRLGPYDCRSPSVIEQHARWIAESGAGAVNVSWWGPGSREDLAVPLLMDVMRDHGLKVAFHLEPYAEDHGYSFQEDVLYLLREYGERRRYDALLILRNADGREGPVFKGFRTILPRESRDCRGVSRPVPDYTPDEVFRRQLDGLRSTLRGEFDHVTLLADSLDFVRAPAAGFDGVAIYDSFVAPAAYAVAAARASEAGVVFSFNVNPGYDSIEPRVVAPDSCYQPPLFLPQPSEIDWSSAAGREEAAALAESRISESLAATLQAQSDAALVNARRGFLLVYLNSWNEWHEGHALEPMKDAALLSTAERRLGYHNPARGDHRLRFLTEQLRPVLAAASAARATAA
jgi:hypothetical protein